MASPRSHRRDFLKGKAAAQVIAHVAAQAADSPGEFVPPIGPEHYQVKLSRRAMACEFEIWLNAGEYPHGSTTALEALDLVDQIEQQLTVYRDTSEICGLNRAATAGPMEVEPHLFELLAQSIELSRLTEGAFDITAGPLSELWGFKRRAGRLPSADEITAVQARVGVQHLALDLERSTIHFLREGIEINLGGIGKGYALDRCTRLFDAAGIADYLFHGGNSSLLARGSNASRPDGGWSIGVRNPLKPQRYLGELILRDRALSTSGSGTQFFVHGDNRYGHILDPRTGWPAEGVLSTTVVAPTAAEAEALSTAFYVLGPEATRTWCAERQHIGCLMLCPGETAGSMTWRCFNLTPDVWRSHADDSSGCSTHGIGPFSLG